MSLEIIAKEGLESLGRFYGTYRGIVSEEIDPDNRGRIGVIVPGVCNKPTWAIPFSQDGNLGSGFKWLSPKKGQMVFIQYQYGNPSTPLWSYHGWALRECPPELKGNDTFGFVTPNGQKVIINEKSGELNLQISDTQGERVKIDIQGGKLNIDTTKEVIFHNGSEGIPISSELIKEFNQIKQDINELKLAFSTGLAEALTVIAPGLTTLLINWSIQTLPPSKQEQIENKKILQ
jgi:hypothetical protein